MIEICNECGATMMTVSELRVHKRMKHGFAKAERSQKLQIREWKLRKGLGIDWVN
jgi:hypothetical protein